MRVHVEAGSVLEAAARGMDEIRKVGGRPSDLEVTQHSEARLDDQPGSIAELGIKARERRQRRLAVDQATSSEFFEADLNIGRLRYPVHCHGTR
jgi:hypothetical protein